MNFDLRQLQPGQRRVFHFECRPTYLKADAYIRRWMSLNPHHDLTLDSDPGTRTCTVTCNSIRHTHRFDAITKVGDYLDLDGSHPAIRMSLKRWAPETERYHTFALDDGRLRVIRVL